MTPRSVNSRRLVLAVLLAVAVVLLAAQAPPAAAQGVDEEPVADEPVVRSITFPVVGPVTYTDTWGACRGYRCSRSHEGADLFGVKLAPLVAAADGVIVSERRSGLTSAGNKVVIEDDEGWRYVYLHLNNDTPGTDDGANPQAWIIPNRLRVGDRVAAGDVIGYLGDSGNAERTPSHLHFELHDPVIGPVNPTRSLERAQAEGRVIPVAPLASSRQGRAEHAGLITAWYQALLGREPTSAELFAWADRFDIGFADRDDLIADLTMAPSRRGPAGAVLRCYQVALDRRPSLDELRSWEQEYRSGLDVEGIVGALLRSQELTDRHGPLDDAGFVEVVYVNARGRAPSESVRRYWRDQLAEGRDRADMATYFVESYGLKNDTWHALEVQQAFRAALDRLPTDDELEIWVAHLDAGGLIVDIVDGIKD